MKVYEIIEATKGQLLSGDKDLEITGFIQDSRVVENGQMYIPIIGERLDGHEFIEQAFNNGASAIISSKKVNYPDKVVIYVEDTLIALQDMARYIRETRNIKVIGITGSVGKTSTKDMVYSVISTKYKTLKTLGNYNNEIGLPLTLLRYQDEEVVILEMGMNHLREMALLSSIAMPDIAIITNVGTAHIGEVGSRENILKAKLEIMEHMKAGSTVIINNDNDMLNKAVISNMNVITVGLESESKYVAYDVNLYQDNSDFKVMVEGIPYRIDVPVQGKHFVTNAMLALVAGKCLEIEEKDIIRGIQSFELTKNRMDTIVLNDITILDGTYNASEDSMKSSLDVLSNYKGRKIAILGDMLEMGSFSKELHENVGSYVSSCKIDVLFCVGIEAKHIYNKAIDKNIDAYYYKSNEEVITHLNKFVEGGDVVLLKASNSMNLKEVVVALKEKK